ncbi:hypothetical protein ACFLRM_02470 [Acidobacteriota bacterium]
MNWFERYGIPGAYFVGYTIALTYIFHSHWVKCIFLSPEVLKAFPAFVAIIFLPIGYIITVFQQWIYLKYLGLLRSAQKTFNPAFFGIEKREHILEAIWEFQVTHERMRLREIENMQNWSRKRMDIMAISLSIILGTIVSFVFVVIIPLGFPIGAFCCLQWGAIVFSALIILIMILIWRALKTSIVALLVRIFIRIENNAT